MVNSLSVSANTKGKHRLILDLRFVNHCIPKEKVNFEDLKVAVQYLSIGGFIFSFDLNLGYLFQIFRNQYIATYSKMKVEGFHVFLCPMDTQMPCWLIL